MQLVQILLPLYDNDGQPFPRQQFESVRAELTDLFGGVTAYVRSPAQGLWQEDDGSVARDDVVIHEVMVEDLDGAWWQAYGERLRRAFAQEELVVRAWQCSRLS